MIDHDLVISRLRAAALFRLVDGAAGLAAAMRPGAALGDGPNAYVAPLADTPARPVTRGGPQIVETTFTVVMMVSRHGEALGGKGMSQIKSLQQQLHAALLGWSIVDGLDPLWWSGSRLLDFTPSALWWSEEFTTRGFVFPIS